MWIYGECVNSKRICYKTVHARRVNFRPTLVHLHKASGDCGLSKLAHKFLRLLM